jgi:PAS domain S-box-containing protein
MFTAMNLIRSGFQRIVEEVADPTLRQKTVAAVDKIIDLELAIMLETYREAFVDEVQRLERLEKARLEGELAVSEARYEEIVEKAGSLVTTFDESCTILLFNSRCEELTKLSRSQAIGQKWFDVFVLPDEHARVKAVCERVLGGERVLPYEGPVPTSARRVRWHFTTLPTSSGAVLCAIGIDVTEERELQLRTQRSERLAALGTMAAGLAHEIRNPLNAASLQLQVVERRLRRERPKVEGALEASGLVGVEMKRLANLVDEFLQFARPQPLRLVRADLRHTVEELVALIRPEAIAAGVEVSLRKGDGASVQIDEERIKQVLLNLLRNALEAAGRGGRIELRVRADAVGVIIEVEDDGPGLPSSDAPIFEPFYTTKESGTGLGLSIVHRIISDHGGTIGVQSRPGRTVFTLSLPAG